MPGMITYQRLSLHRTIRLVVGLLALGLLLAACNGEDGTEGPDPTAAPTQPPGDVDDVELPAVPTPPEATQEIDEGQTVAPTAAVPTEAGANLVDPTATSEPAVEAEAVAVNGSYEETFFRGRADAPVTIIDYSDFL